MMIKMQRHFLIVVTVSWLSLFAGIAQAADIMRQVNPEDPYEPFNRVMYNFNEVLDKYLIKPVATLYNKVVPKPLTKGIANFFSNIDTVPTVANDVLQANFYQATSDAWRLAINTTVGIGGFFDVAADMGLEHNYEDLGLTFARWGYTQSNYLVLPFLGPSTVRDGVAWPINYEYLTIYPYITPVRARYQLYALNLVSKRADLLRYQDVMQQATLDKYVFMRNAYLQRRNYLIQRNKELGDPYLEDKTVASKK
jgi:phospholipid-binding lipoprotein MlaA